MMMVVVLLMMITITIMTMLLMMMMMGTLFERLVTLRLWAAVAEDVIQWDRQHWATRRHHHHHQQQLVWQVTVP